MRREWPPSHIFRTTEGQTGKHSILLCMEHGARRHPAASAPPVCGLSLLRSGLPWFTSRKWRFSLWCIAGAAWRMQYIIARHSHGKCLASRRCRSDSHPLLWVKQWLILLVQETNWSVKISVDLQLFFSCNYQALTVLTSPTKTRGHDKTPSIVHWLLWVRAGGQWTKAWCYFRLLHWTGYSRISCRQVFWSSAVSTSSVSRHFFLLTQKLCFPLTVFSFSLFLKKKEELGERPGLWNEHAASEAFSPGANK